MLPNLFAALLAITAGLLFHQNWNLHQTNSSLNQALKKQNLQVREQQLALMKEMREDVKEEMLNMGIFRNEGLLDTLTSIRNWTDSLFQADEISQKDLDAYKAKLNRIISSQIRNQNYDALSGEMLDRSFAIDEAVLEYTKSYLLACEKEVLWLLNTRLGLAICNWVLPLHIEISPMSKSVVLGDTLKQKLNIYSKEGHHLLYYPHSFRSSFSTSMGSIKENRLGEIILSIPTDDLLASGEESREITYMITAHIPKASGGYRSFSKEDSFLLVRPSK